MECFFFTGWHAGDWCWMRIWMGFGGPGVFDGAAREGV